MTEPRDPVRWTDPASDCDPVLRRVLGTAREGLGDAARAQGLALDIEQSVRAAAANGGETLDRPAWRGPRRWLVLGVAGVIAVLCAVAWIRSATAPRPGSQRGVESAPAGTPRADTRPHAARDMPRADTPPRVERDMPRTEAPTRSASDHSAAVPPPVPVAAPAPRVAPAADRGAPLAQHTAARRARAGTAHVSRRDAAGAQSPATEPSYGAGVAPAQTDVPPELQLLSAAQRALRAAPADALALAEQHARAYPAGQFTQEREEIAITALFALGKRSVARARAREFLARYSRSLAAARIEALLEDRP